MYPIIGVGTIVGVILSIYIFGLYFAPVDLRVVMTCPTNSTPPSQCGNAGPPYFMLDDSLVIQSPKLKEGLTQVLSVEPVNGEKTCIVKMNMAEFDAMNNLLVNTNQTKVLDEYAHRENPTLSLFPKANSIAFVDYDGSSYQLIPDYPILTPFGQWWA